MNKKLFEKLVKSMREAGEIRCGKYRSTAIDKKHAKALEGTLTEWSSKGDEKAYRKL